MHEALLGLGYCLLNRTCEILVPLTARGARSYRPYVFIEKYKQESNRPGPEVLLQACAPALLTQTYTTHEDMTMLGRAP